jgi:hypothetical protein
MGNFRLMQGLVPGGSLPEIHAKIKAIQKDSELTLGSFIVSEVSRPESTLLLGNSIPEPLKLKYRALAPFVAQLEDAYMNYDDERVRELTTITRTRQELRDGVC